MVTAPTATDFAWAAGILDGEGCIHISKRVRNGHYRYNLILLVGNTSEPMLQRLQEVLGGTVGKETWHRHSKRPFRNWLAYGKDAQVMLAKIEPFLVAKRAHAWVAIRFPIGRSRSRPQPLFLFGQAVGWMVMRRLVT